MIFAQITQNLSKNQYYLQTLCTTPNYLQIICKLFELFFGSVGSARVPCAATHFVPPCALSDDGAAPSWARRCPSYAPSLLSTPVQSCAHRSKPTLCQRVERVPRITARVRPCGVRCSRVVLCSRRVLRAVCPCSASRHGSKW